MSKRKDEEFFKLVEDTKEYVCLTSYKSRTTKMLMLHLKCGKYYYQTPEKFTKGRRCHHCSKSKKLTKELIQNELDTNFPGRYTILSEYKNSRTKIKVRDNECGHEYEIKQQDIRSGKRCFRCHGSKKYSQKEFLELFNKKKMFGYSLVGIYDGINSSIEIKHDKCGEVFNIIPSRYFNQGKNCPKCYPKSVGELKVKNILINREIIFEEQKRFNDCKNVYSLPFDFYLPDLNTCIEYQGLQHFEVVGEFGGEEAFEYRKENDRIKRDFCKNNNIKLIEIPYWEKDVEKYLVEKIC